MSLFTTEAAADLTEVVDDHEVTVTVALTSEHAQLSFAAAISDSTDVREFVDGGIEYKPELQLLAKTSTDATSVKAKDTCTIAESPYSGRTFRILAIERDSLNAGVVLTLGSTTGD